MATNTQARDQMNEQAGKAQQTAQQAQQTVKQGAQQTAEKLSGPTQDAFQELTAHDNPAKGYEAFWEKLPTSAYFWGAAGSMALSALLLLADKQKLAIFVGLWPMTIINGAVMMKRLKPSEEL